MESKKVLLLNPPGSRLYIRDMYCSFTSKGNYYWQPIDLAVLSGMLSGKHEVSVIDAIAEDMKEEDVLRRIGNGGYDFIISLTGSASWNEDKRFFEKVKKNNYKVKLLLSGDFLLEKARDTLEEICYIDGALLNFTTDDVLRYLEACNGGCGQKINNIVYRMNGDIYEGDLVTDSVKFEINSPRHDLFPLDKYRILGGREGKIAVVLTSFGCPFKCYFCLSGTIQYRYRPAENVMQELLYLRNLGVKEVNFRDPLFESNKQNIVRLLRVMRDKDLGMSFSCNCRVDTLDEKLISLMKEAGCYFILFGVESADKNIMKNIGKKIDRKKTKDTFKLCRKHKIRTAAYFILGLPGETRKSAMETIAFAKELKPDFVSFSVPSPDYRTELRKQAIEKGWISPHRFEFNRSEEPVIMNENLTFNEIKRFKNIAMRSFYLNPQFIFKNIIRIRSFREARNLYKEGINAVKNIF